MKGNVARAGAAGNPVEGDAVPISSADDQRAARSHGEGVEIDLVELVSHAGLENFAWSRSPTWRSAKMTALLSIVLTLTVLKVKIPASATRTFHACLD